MVKRPRITLTCFFCQKRKVKCDRGTPCSSCIKYNKVCEYPRNEELLNRKNNRSRPTKLYDTDSVTVGDPGLIDDPIVADGNIVKSSSASVKLHWDKKDFPMLESINAVNTYFETIDKIKYSPEDDHQVGDIEINLLHQYNNLIIDEPYKRRFMGPISWNAIVRTDPFLNKLWERVYTRLDSDEKLDFVVKLPSPTDLHLNETEAENFHNRVKHDEGRWDGRNQISAGEIVDEINKILPSSEIRKVYLDRFFNHIIQFLPIIDQSSFMDNLTRIIVNNRVISKDKLDFIIIGQLCIMLRISYVSYASHSDAISEEAIFLESNKIDAKFYDLCQSCINQFNLATSNLEFLRLLIMFKFYKEYAPELGDSQEIGETQISNSLLLQSAFQLGLHLDKRYENLWNFLLECDCLTFLSIGDVNNIDKFNVKSDNFLVSFVSELNTLKFNFTSFKINDMNNIINKYDKLLDDHGKDDTFELTKFLIKKLQLNYFKLSIYSHYYNYLNHQYPDLSNKYLYSMIRICYNKILPIIINYFINEDIQLVDFMILPYIEKLIHKTLLLNLSILVRLNLLHPHCRIINKVINLSKNLINFIVNLSNKYYFSWRITRIQTFLLECVMYNVEFFRDATTVIIGGDFESEVDHVLSNALSNIEFSKNFKLFESSQFQIDDFIL
ncbi:hypothetical protein CLIB1444_01S13564 [[Candida] jaroonii]|uniref:Uncharacterized protein n=1 Tax=[Candida] jaroonii TaxID=467808 RepID=A0ACA9Y1A9_9ASCO|nr:hypothetical protein CLIB1444_01S13564 [[Candida] jaroonii]